MNDCVLLCLSIGLCLHKHKYRMLVYAKNRTFSKVPAYTQVQPFTAIYVYWGLYAAPVLSRLGKYSAIYTAQDQIPVCQRPFYACARMHYLCLCKHQCVSETSIHSRLLNSAPGLSGQGKDTGIYIDLAQL